MDELDRKIIAYSKREQRILFGLGILFIIGFTTFFGGLAILFALWGQL